MTNLLEETTNVISSIGRKIEDISWVGSRDGEYTIDWIKFKEIANKEYDSGYGAPEVAQDLVIVFNDGSYLERYEYDGAESWQYQSTPKKKRNAKTFDKLFAFELDRVGWENINGLNNLENN